MCHPLFAITIEEFVFQQIMVNESLDIILFADDTTLSYVEIPKSF